MDAGTIRQIAIAAIPILVAITFHEAAHAFAAYRLGDRTAWAVGRMTLNPIKHIDPMGTVLLPIILLILTHGQYTFGYAKPVPINPYNFRNPRKGMAITGGAGPATNFVLAFISMIIFKLILSPLSMVVPESLYSSVFLPLEAMIMYSVVINIFLACFNLLPVPPLDGSRVLAGLLPRNQANAIDRLEPYGMIIILILFITRIYRWFVIPLFLFFIGIINFIFREDVLLLFNTILDILERSR